MISLLKADKGDTIEVETTENYIKDGLTQFLSNQKYYHRLAEDFNPNIENAIKKFLINAHQRGLIDSETFHFLSPPNPSRTPLIYSQKLHKDPISVRPIVSHVNSATSNISAFLDNILKPIVKEIPHILSNSAELIRDLQTITVSENTILVSLDIVSLYP